MTSPSTPEESYLEATLLRRIAGREASALGELYDLHSSHIYALIWRILSDQVEAEEALLRTFKQVWDAGKSSEFGSPAAWLTRTARDIAIDCLLSKPRATLEGARELSRTETRTEHRGEIIEAISQLPVEEWSLIEHAYFRGYTRTKLAEHFEMSVEAVKTLIHKRMLSLSVRLPRLVGERVAPIGSVYLDELAALDAVGALDGEDIGEFKRIAPNVSPETQKEIARYREVAALFAYGCVSEKQPPAVLRERLLHLIQNVPPSNHQMP